jgi:hypothetical protein
MGGLCAFSSIQAQEPSPATSGSANLVLSANTLVPLRLLEPVGSDTHVRGQFFRLEVSEDIRIDGVVVIPAGSPVTGQVIHAAKSGMLAKPGELTLTSRFVAVGERQIKLHSLLSQAGTQYSDLALGVTLIVPLAPFFVRGRKVLIPADTPLVARVAADEVFAAPAATP